MISLFFTTYFLILISLILPYFINKKNKIKNSILYLENFPIENAGYQYRAEKWAELLRKKGYHVEIWTLNENKVVYDFQIKQKPFSRYLTWSLKKRFTQVWASRKFETVIVRRELLWFNDYGNLFLDKLLLKIHQNVILDIDDDLSAAKKQPKKITNLFGILLLENGNKFNESLRLYKRFFVASNYLKQRVLKENPTLSYNNVCVIPTCVDYDQYEPKSYSKIPDKITFGWIGGDHNYPQLDTIIHILNDLGKEYNFELLVVGGTKYVKKSNFEIVFKSWTLENEIELIKEMTVGLMPLKNNLSTKGKGGFKLLQYMGLGVVSVASDVTINSEIIIDSKNSFLALNDSSWREILLKILRKQCDFSQIGHEARKTILNKYTFNSNLEKYVNHLCSN
jgi:glycosyltransferase involved in cell wall biosynthesis